MKLLIAIDDTDNLQSRGTGHCARQLAERLAAEGLALVEGITRHQLYVHDDIPFTSHNSSACMLAQGEDPEKIAYFCGRFLLNSSAPGSDAGLCVAVWEQVSDDITDWGIQAKRRVLTMDEARQRAAAAGIFLQGFTGTHGGIIGSLAAVGLRKAGNDGRYLHVAGMRRLMGVMRAEEILRETGVETIETIDGATVTGNPRILLDAWWRPLLRNNKATLIVETILDHPYHEYRIIPKNILKERSA